MYKLGQLVYYNGRTGSIAAIGHKSRVYVVTDIDGWDIGDITDASTGYDESNFKLGVKYRPVAQSNVTPYTPIKKEVICIN